MKGAVVFWYCLFPDAFISPGKLINKLGWPNIFKMVFFAAN